MVMAASGKLHSKVKMKKNLGDHDPEQCNHRLNAVYIHEKKTRAVDGKDKIQIVNNDIIREAIVPNREPLDLPGIWQRSEFKRLQDQAHVVTLEDKKAMLEEAERKRNEEMYGSEMRKAALAKAHIRQEPKIGSKLNNVIVCKACDMIVSLKDYFDHSCVTYEDIFSKLDDIKDVDMEILSSVEPEEAIEETVEEILITAIKNRPALWDNRIPSAQRSRTIRDILWAEVFHLLEGKFTIKELQQKWKVLKEQFNYTYNTAPKGSGDTDGQQRVWKHYSAMKFLEELIPSRKKKTHFTLSNNDQTIYQWNSDNKPEKPKQKPNKIDEVPKKYGDVYSESTSPIDSPIQELSPRRSEFYKGNLVCARIAELLEQLPPRRRYELEIDMLQKVENDAKDKSEYLLQRSKELINEQDDRVKVANGLILATKCRAIRNAQIIEKEIIRKQLLQESRRLDDMMEQERQRCLAEDERKAEQEDHRNKRHGKEIKQQIKDNEVEKLLEAERKEEECRMINKALIAMRKEEQEKVKQHKASQEKVRKELHQANLDMERYKLIQKEEQRISDLRVQEFMRQKAAREEAREAELALAKSQKEKEISRLRQQQENAQDKQAIEDEMNAIRIQEEVERAWRDKEMKAAIKKISDMKALNEARALQIENTRKAQAISIARDEVNFHKVARVQYELFQKDTEKKAQKKARNNKHRQDILKQINEKERQRINQVKEKFEDGKVFRLNQAIRDNQIEGYIKQKINKLRQEPISPNYVKDIERQLQITDS